MLAINIALADHAVDHPAEESLLGGTGCAGQGLQLRNTPVLAGSAQLQILVGGNDDGAWREAPGWEQVRPHERAYLLSPETGEIRFGDGLHGRVPLDGSRIVVTSYKTGGGTAGNLPAGSLEKWLGQEQVGVAQPFPATGGAETESLDEAKGRALLWLSAPQRAVSLADYERMAKEVPGVPVLRAHALADYDPALPGLPALGCVTVIVLPAQANPLPEAGPDMLCAVQSYLQHRSVLTTEVHVIAPAFLTVAVSARLSATAGANASALMSTSQASLNAFLDPLYGGVDGTGWPAGRAVYPSEIMAVLNSLPGVEYVDDVRIEVESRLQSYRGFITWMQNFKRATDMLTLRVQLLASPGLPAGRVTGRVRKAVQAYFQTPRGSSNLDNASLCQDVTGLLAALPDVIIVESLKIDENGAGTGSCGTVTLCAHEVVVPGTHILALAGAAPAVAIGKK